MAHFEIQNLTFTYPTAGGRPSLTDVSLTVEPGEYVVLCGRSGSGKTTLLRQLKPSPRPPGARAAGGSCPASFNFGRRSVAEIGLKLRPILAGACKA